MVFVRGPLCHGLVRLETMRERLTMTDLDEIRRGLCQDRLNRLAA